MLQVGLSKKLDPILNPSPANIFSIKLLRYDFNDIEPCFSDYLKLTSWDLLTPMGLANMSGTWDLGPRAN